LNKSAARLATSERSTHESIPGEWHGVTEGGIPWHVFLGDAKHVLSTLPANHYNCIVTSPPYYWLRDYEIDNQIGLEESVSGYVNNISAALDQAFRVLKSNGVLFLNLGDTYYSGKGKSHGEDRKSRKRRFGLRAVDKSGGLGIGLKPKTIIGIPWRVAIELSTRGWVLRSSIIWYREHALPESVQDRPRRSYEYVFMFVKQRSYFFNRRALDTLHVEDMWTIPARPKPTNGLPTAPFPDELVQRCLEIGCPENGLVLDPFAGSGTTLRVALASGREATGIDLHPEFCRYMVGHLNDL